MMMNELEGTWRVTSSDLSQVAYNRPISSTRDGTICSATRFTGRMADNEYRHVAYALT
jgi:hypothetical protein